MDLNKKLIITTAQKDAAPNWNMLRGLETYVKKHNAELLILPTNGRHPKNTIRSQEERLHNYFTDNFQIIEGNYDLNKNIQIRDFLVKAQQINPLTGFRRKVHKTTIMASPKQMLEVVPNSNYDLPKILMSTGAITQPNYKDNPWGRGARDDHKYGAILVELVDGDKFHYRDLSAGENGVFYDLGVRYDGDKTPRRQCIDALVMGDIHAAHIDPYALQATFDLIRETKPKNAIFHDLFDGESICYFDRKKLAVLAGKHDRGATSLEEELRLTGELLNTFHYTRQNMNLIIVRSNHDERIDRYLNEGRFVEDPENVDISLKLFQAMRQGKNTLEEGIRLTYGRVNRTKYLTRKDDFKIRGWQLSNHGDLGANGAKGSPPSLEAACAKQVAAHSHTQRILRNLRVVGTKCALDTDYARGFSSWTHTDCIIHPNGQAQMVNYIDGQYKG